MPISININPQHLIVSDAVVEQLDGITPIDDTVIVRVIPNPDKTSKGIVIPSKACEKSTLALVLIANKVSYNRDGSQRKPVLNAGDLVRLQRGNVGTEMPEAPEGEKWLAVPEDVIYYSMKL